MDGDNHDAIPTRLDIALTVQLAGGLLTDENETDGD